MRPHNTEAIRNGMTAPHADMARQARRIAGLRGNSLGISLMHIAEYRLGIGVNLYVHIRPPTGGTGSRPQSWCVSVLYTFAAKNADSLGVPLNPHGAGTPFSADRQWVAGCVDGYNQTHPRRRRRPTRRTQWRSRATPATTAGDPQMGMAYQVFEPENAGGMTAAAQVALAMPGNTCRPVT
jgi:hypothetical protein